jgi:hypothetical protein
MVGDEFGNFLGMSMGLEVAVCKIFLLAGALLLAPLFCCVLFPSKLRLAGTLADGGKSLLVTSNLFLIFSTLLLDSGGDTYDIVTPLQYDKYPTLRMLYTLFTTVNILLRPFSKWTQR